MYQDKLRRLLAQNDRLGDSTHDGDEYGMPDVAPSLQDDELGQGTMDQHNYGEPLRSGIMGVVVDDEKKTGSVNFDQDKNLFQKIMEMLGSK